VNIGETNKTETIKERKEKKRKQFVDFFSLPRFEPRIA